MASMRGTVCKARGRVYASSRPVAHRIKRAPQRPKVRNFPHGVALAELMLEESIRQMREELRGSEAQSGTNK